jgi:dolichol-phosphate mannosyltransferase
VIALLSMASIAVLWRVGDPEAAPVVDWIVVLAVAAGYLIGWATLTPPRQRATHLAEPPSGAMAGAWIIIPTYCEAGNIGTVLKGLLDIVPGATVLVVDDNSPDGTGAVVDQFAKQNPLVRLVERRGDRGLAGAWMAGFKKALSEGARVVVTLDADGSHDPADLPRLLAALSDADVVVGSRYVRQGRTEGWPLRRRLLSRAANAYARYVLDLKTHDCTSGFRAYRAEALAPLLDSVSGDAGYALLPALLFRARQAGLRTVEASIVFRERKAGRSKLRLGEARRGARFLWRLAAWPAVRAPAMECNEPAGPKPADRCATVEPAGLPSAVNQRLHALAPVLVCAAILAYTVVMGWSAAYRHQHYGSNGFDLGIYDQALWLIRQGEAPYVTVRGLHILGDHFTPILYPLSLLYLLAPQPEALLVFQTAFLALAAWPLFRIGVNTSGCPEVGLLGLSSK